MHQASDLLDNFADDASGPHLLPARDRFMLRVKCSFIALPGVGGSVGGYKQRRLLWPLEC